ncbi:unnamed protein product [Ophioblennius macclurei]
MEPDVIRMYSSSPPPMEDGAEEEDDEFGDFGTFSGVPNSISFSEFDTPTTFNQTQALTATSPPELLNNRGVAGLGHGTSNGTHIHRNELSKANGVAPPNRPDSGVTERTEIKKVLTGSPDRPENDSSGSETADCNGGGPELITNGFTTSDVQGSPSSQSSVHCHITESSTQDSADASVGSPEEKFADFAVFPGAEVCLSRTVEERQEEEEEEEDSGDSWEPAVEPSEEQQAALEDSVTDTNRTGADVSSCGPADTPNGSCNTDRGPDADSAPPQEHTDRCFTQDGTDELKDRPDLSPAGSEAARLDDKSSENETETETETETSFGRPLSTDALEEFGDVSTTASAPSPPPLGDTTTPADDSQLAEDDEDFGDFGDAGSFGGPDFAEFEQQEEQSAAKSSVPVEQGVSAEQDDDFGDFNSPKLHSGVDEKEGEGTFASFPVSDSFGNFTVAEEGDGAGEWSAFGGQEEEEEEGESWAAFSTEPSAAPPAEEAQEELKEVEEAEVPVHSDEGRQADGATVSLSGRLEKLFQSSFPQSDEHSAHEEVVTLKTLLEAPAGDQGAQQEEQSSPCNRSQCGGVWMQLQDIHEALGLRYQWGGSHCNKSLLCCLGIDTRNILFTGQKKQPVIVPMYAAGLGMLEPTKEPVKPVSAAEMIASIGQAPPAAPPPAPPADSSSSNSDPAQEALPPVQFDWSSSGLTNPLDGVDPELFELTTVKLEASGPSSRMADAFARLMSTMEKTSTSTRRPRREENLSEEALAVIAVLPDLSFMQAKVLMFPATLTPLGSQATPSQLLAPPTSSN